MNASSASCARNPASSSSDSQVHDERPIMDAADDRHRQSSKRRGDTLQGRTGATRRQWPEREAGARECSSRQCAAANLAVATDNVDGRELTDRVGDDRLQAIGRRPDLGQRPRQ